MSVEHYIYIAAVVARAFPHLLPYGSAERIGGGIVAPYPVEQFYNVAFSTREKKVIRIFERIHHVQMVLQLPIAGVRSCISGEVRRVN